MFETLPGFRDFYPDQCRVRNHVLGMWRKLAIRFGFQEFDCPLLEPLELYVEKSGEEIAEQLFQFEDKGGRKVALRPEMTPSLARYVGAKAQSLKKPIKWFSVGECFRYERPQKGRTRSFYQFNADILGEESYTVDVELIALLVETLRAFGLDDSDFKVRLSDRKLWVFYLEASGVKSSDIPAILFIIDKFEKLPREKIEEQLKPYLKDSLGSFLEGVDALTKVRSVDSLKEFFSKYGESVESLGERLNDWSQLLSDLESMGLSSFIQVDLSVVRGLAYYTGFVYEAFEVSGKSRALAGGGRYDELLGKLGGKPMPAAGFAVGDVTLTDLLESKGLLPNYISKPDVYVVADIDKGRSFALSDISKLREAGLKVEYPLKSLSWNKQLKLAKDSGARFALIYGGYEIDSGCVKVRDLQERLEKDVPLTEAVFYLIAIKEEGRLISD